MTKCKTKERKLSKGEKFCAFAFASLLALLLYAFIADNYTNSCDECGKTFFGPGYYDYTQTMTLCEDCARTYWAPFSYKDFKK